MGNLTLQGYPCGENCESDYTVATGGYAMSVCPFQFNSFPRWSGIQICQVFVLPDLTYNFCAPIFGDN